MKKCKECKKPIVGRQSRAIYCSQKCAKKVTSRNEWRRNKEHIKNKRMERKVTLGKVLPKDTEIVYKNYKEPLTKVKNGYGYMGVVATNKTGTHIQCHECGLFFEYLAGHIRLHKLDKYSYKNKYGLMFNTALISDATREKLVNSYKLRVNRVKDGKRVEQAINASLKKYWADVKSGKVKRSDRRRGKGSLEQKNLKGTCPDQLLDAIREVAEDLGRVPTVKEFGYYKNSRFISPIYYTYGSWENAVRSAGYTPRGEAKDLAWQEARKRENLIKVMQDFYKRHGRVPTASDFRAGMIGNLKNYQREFGSIAEARRAADLPELVKVRDWLGRISYVETIKETK